jgi:23S rRNA G2445 N2-methylase RlmL
MKFFVTCARGTEGALRRELVVQRIHAPRGAAGGVSFDGTLEDGMKVCLWSRVAMRVLLEVGRFPASDADTLYAGVHATDLSRFLGSKTTLAVTATTQDNLELHHSGFAALKVKDAVVDALRDRLGHRPNVDVKSPMFPSSCTCAEVTPVSSWIWPASRSIDAATGWPWPRRPSRNPWPRRCSPWAVCARSSPLSIP